jgi:class 3 adenylate cyclase/CheY-like chemotaxis protein
MPRVLVVEDSPTQAKFMEMVLQDAGFEVATAGSAEGGLDLLHRDRFDVVLSDLHLPGDSGFDLCRRLKSDPDLQRIPVVVCTSEADPVNVLRGLEAGADGFITKHRAPDEIVGCVRRALARGRTAEPANKTLVAFLNQRYELTAGREQLLDVLVSAFEDVVHLNRQLESEKRRADELLHVLFPDKIVVELKASSTVKPHRHDHVAVMFVDIVGFTQYCERHGPEEILTNLQRLVEDWEEIAVRHHVEKIKTIGDAFMAACGLLKRVENPVLNTVRCGVEMIEASRRLPPGFDVRVGVHLGPVVAGVLGRRQYLFDLWGNTVNEAARIQANGVVGSVCLSVEAWKQVAPLARGESLGSIPIKGMGTLEIIRFAGFQ